MMMNYHLVHRGEHLGPLREDSYVVPIDSVSTPPSLQMMLNAADNPGLAVIPLIENLEWQDDDLPDLDTVDELGFDGTLRGDDGRPAGEPVTWKDVAKRLLEQRNSEVEITLTRDDLDLFTERMEDIEDPHNSLFETVFDINGVRVKLV